MEYYVNKFCETLEFQAIILVYKQNYFICIVLQSFRKKMIKKFNFEFPDMM